MRTDEHAIIMQDRLILAVAALETIRALGGDAGQIADDTLAGFERADKDDASAPAPQTQRGEG